MRRWGRFVYRRRKAVLVVSLLCFVLSLVGLLTGGQPINASDYNVESVQAANLESAQLPSTTGSSFTLILTSSQLTYGDPQFEADVNNALAPLHSDSRVSALATPFTSAPTVAALMVSTDKHSVLAQVGLHIDFSEARAQYGEIRGEVHSSALSITATGDVPLAYDFDTFLASDLRRSEVVSLPLALILLVIVFTTGVAALLCLGVGIFAVLGGVGAALALAHVYDVSTYAVNVVTLVGLGIAIDYSLFIVTRFREELGNGLSVEDALATTMATAGRAIMFSGLTVAIGLSGLLFYTGTALVSMGVAGAIVVAISVLYGVTLLPALLAILGRRINSMRIPIMQPKPFGQGAWHRLATWVMRRPWLVLIPTVAILLVAGSPFLDLQLANSDVNQLPTTAEARQGADLLQRQFPQVGTNTIAVVIDFAHGPPTSPANVATAYALSQRLAALPGVTSIRSYVTVDPTTTLAAYQSMYQQPKAALPSAVQSLLTNLTGSSIAVLDVANPYFVTSDQAHALVRQIRADDSVPGATVKVTGDTAFDIDLVNYMIDHTPLAIAFVLVTTIIVLTILLRSIVLPFKAVLMNALSLSAAFGALVWIFDQGHLSGFLGFTAGPLDPTIPVLLFCVVFGLSMDYEVFLLTRMQEAWYRSGDNRTAVANGLERSGRLVTGAAAIMACVFLAFALASVVTIKAIGVGMAVAVIVDASLVRALVVPALMRLLGKANWWAPAWLRRRNPELEEIAPAA
ncbi:MAG TPA: MMPL family transporter [Candidatus Dormibacteraeota bacterium]